MKIVDEESLDEEKERGSFSLIKAICITAPLWLPFLAAYFCNIAKASIGPNKSLYENIIFLSAIVSCLIGTVAIASIQSKGRVYIAISIILYLVFSAVALFVVGWGALLMVGSGH